MMPLLPRARSWLRATFDRDRTERDMADELSFHIEQYARDLETKGLSREDALAQARAAFGSVAARQDECREALGLRLLDEFKADLRYAVRLLRRSPAFTAVAVTSLALGIGANAAIFSLVDAILLKSLPVHDPGGLVFVDNTGGKSHGSNAPPYPCFEILRDHSTMLDGMAAFDGRELRVSIDGAEERLTGQYTSGNYFDVLGLHPAYGRLLSMADDRSGAPASAGVPVVISYALWQRRFGKDPSVLGRTIRVSQSPATIVGVTPPGFYGLTVGHPIDLTLPFTASGSDLTEKSSWWFSVVARLRSGVNVDAARAELDGLFQSYMVDNHLSRDYFNRIELIPAGRGLDEVRREFSLALQVTMTIVGIVLAIGCANVASLLLARASARRSEMVVRLAIGAGRGRLIRQMLTEGAVLAALGAGLGLAIAKFAVSVLVSLVSGVQHRIELQPQFDTRVLAFTTVVALITGLLFSLTPALHATSNRAAAPLAGPRDRTATARSRAGRALVVLQIALSLILLSGAALFVRTLHNLLTLDPGFSRESIVMLSVDGRPSRRPWREDPRGQRTEAWQVWSALLIRASALPGVTSASAATLSPLGGHDRGVRLAVIGGAPGPVADMGIHLNHVSAHYFTTMGMDLRRGRPFDDRDRDGAPRVAILNETAARGYFGDADPLGRRITFPGQVIQDEYEIVGVVRDVRYDNLRTADERMAFVPIAQSIDRISRVQLAVRSAMPVRGLADALRQAVQTTVPGGFPGDALTMEQQVEESLLQERLVSLLASIFGGLALILACIGLYGVLAYTVAGRTREIGIRIAIGARRLEVIWLVLRETIVLMVLAIALGLPIVLWSATYVASALFGVEPRDPLALGAAVASLLTVAAAAAFLPARRASRIDPMIALRHE